VAAAFTDPVDGWNTELMRDRYDVIVVGARGRLDLRKLEG
jgi:nucleotide-binding universal stress UspA family protein